MTRTNGLGDTHGCHVCGILDGRRVVAKGKRGGKGKGGGKRNGTSGGGSATACEEWGAPHFRELCANIIKTMIDQKEKAIGKALKVLSAKERAAENDIRLETRKASVSMVCRRPIGTTTTILVRRDHSFFSPKYKTYA